MSDVILEYSELARRDYSISLADANLYALANAVPLAAILTISYWSLWGWSGVANGIDTILSHWVIPLILFLGGIVFHELIHGLTWAIAARKPLSDIEYGVKWQYLTPYAHAKVPLPANAYRLGALMPGVLLGLAPAAWSIATGNGAAFLFGLLFTVAAGGDFLILWLLRRVPGDALVEDHPSRAGCYVLESTSP